MDQLFGKYPGVVVDNEDPHHLGRIKVKGIQELSEDNWAMPCVPYAGKNVGFFAIPPVDARVWVEFACGDPDFPIWSGCYWNDKEDVPLEPQKKYNPETIILKAGTGSISINSKNGDITIETEAGMKVAINEKGIEIKNGKDAKIKLDGGTVSINGDALVVE